MAKATLEQWSKLYDEADQLKLRKPWMKMEDIDWIAIRLPEYREPFYICIMGKHYNCPGISVYYGMEGYSDMYMLMDSTRFPTPVTYVMGDITAMTCYFGNEEDLDLNQIERISALNKTYQGENDWTYFLSFEPRYMPGDLSVDQVIRNTRVFHALNQILGHGDKDPSIWPDYEAGKMLGVQVENSSDDTQLEFSFRSIDMESPFPRYLAISPDKQALDHLKTLPRSEVALALDLDYLFVPVNDASYDRPLNPLLALSYDLRHDQIIDFYVLPLEQDEIDAILHLFFDSIEKKGIPNKLYVRNPRVYYALELICKECDISVEIDALEELDEIYHSISDHV